MSCPYNFFHPMPLTYVSGDPLLTKQPVLAIGSNAAGRTETSLLAMALLTRYPAAFASYGKLCRHGRLAPGAMWVWRETKPALAFMVVRETPVGTSRLRHVDSVIMALARDYALDNIRDIAIAPLGAEHEQSDIRDVLDHWLSKSSLRVTAYTDYQPGVAAEGD